MKVPRAAAVTVLAAVVAAVAGLFNLSVTAAFPDAGGSSASRPQPVNQPLRALGERHDLRIGTAVDMTALAEDTTYRQHVAREFSSVTPENVMKWEVVEPERGQYNWAPADELVGFARRNGQRVRGHTLVWHNQLPSWLTNGDFTDQELRQILRRHIIDEVTHFKGKVSEWDVVNEVIDDNGNLRDTIWLRRLGPGYIADAFRWAHQADPNARLYLNDYNIEGVNPKSDAYYELVKQLLRQGVPVHGIGVQGHLGVQFGFPSASNIAENLRRFQDLGLETAVTEADVRMPLPSDVVKLQAQAQGYSVLLQGCLLTRRCTSFTVWGFTDKYSWVPGFFEGEGAANLLDENFQPKPAYEALRVTLALSTGPRHRGH